jgi:hypothetical protein
MNVFAKEVEQREDLIGMKRFKHGKKISSLAALLCSAMFLIFLSACETMNASDVNNLSVRSVSIQLKHSPMGTTNLLWDPYSRKLDVKIALIGLAPKSSHAAHIHAGSCAAAGAIIYPLQPVVADAKGVGTSETIIKNVQDGILANGWYINIHNGLLTSPIERRPISCGNIVNSNTKKSRLQAVSVTMHGALAPNESARGQAILSSVNGKLTLKIVLRGLEPNSTHVAHVHDGTCAAQGPVLAMLKPVVADSRGNGSSVTTFDQLPTPKVGFYINVHTGATAADLKQPTLFNPIACSNAISDY